MKFGAAMVVMMLPAFVHAGGFPHGLSDGAAEQKPQSQTQRLLQQQRESGAPEQGEMSAQVFVETQKRVSETFQRPVPERLSDLNQRDD